MVDGLVLFSLLGLSVAAIIYTSVSFYMKGYFAGMTKEAKGWLAALAEVTPPNWQSLPVSMVDGEKNGLSKEQIEDANKMYVAAFKIALDAIRDEVIINRITEVQKDIEKKTLLKSDV